MASAKFFPSRPGEMQLYRRVTLPTFNPALCFGNNLTDGWQFASEERVTAHPFAVLLLE